MSMRLDNNNPWMITDDNGDQMVVIVYDNERMGSLIGHLRSSDDGDSQRLGEDIDCCLRTRKVDVDDDGVVTLDVRSRFRHLSQ